MAIRTSEVAGLEELIRATSRNADQAMPGLKTASDSAGRIVLASAKEKAGAMRKTGTLEKSLKLTPAKVKQGKAVTFSKVTFGRDAAYAVPLELGHDIVVNGRHVGEVAARPFLRPAADENQDRVVDVLVEAMNKELDKWGDKG